ncbi:cytochrome P450 [Amycolatopsis magusensis]|uniref:cytochrome P450 n=1 Tax=Amycolatopsis magusensis TaxID=882444 RepID=UPI0024A859D9|nr:cytochrome P450 [Amycolatopsis magusensis]MDI5974932.1 cytochrome P450 [Amycolatopsis magusensis]
MTQDPAAEVPEFPMARRCPFDPPSEYAKLRETEPVSRAQLPDGTPAWLLTRYADARAVLAHPTVSADITKPGFPPLIPIQKDIVKQGHKPPFMRQDPPEHTVYRRMLIPEFTVRRMKVLRPAIEQIVDDQLDHLLAQDRPADLVAHLALPVPSLVICRTLGVPYADHEFFQDKTGILLSFDSTPEQVAKAMTEIRAFLGDLISEKQRTPDDDLVSSLVHNHLEKGEVTRENLLATILLLLNAGHETTANMISLGTLALLENPEQLAALRADPELVGPAVEEMLRYLSIGDIVPARIATEDMEVGGTTIKAGEGLIALLGAANWDTGVFPSPETFDIHRGARHHIAFGYGVHQCVGQNLARLELEILFRKLVSRVPTLRLAAPVEDLPYKRQGAVYGLHALPVSW